MSLVVRAYTDADREGFAHVKSKVYRDGVPIGPEEDLMRPDTFGTVAELDGKIVAVELEIDMTCTLRGSALRCMGVAGVGVLPEKRRTGVGMEMLIKALPIYKERGAAFASLMPFRAHYYRKAGYATAGTRLSMRSPTNRLPILDSNLELWELPRDDYSAIVPCYEGFARKYSGMNIRREEQWRWQLGGDNRFAIYAAGNPPQAFISTRLKTDFWTEQEVRDLAWTSIDGYRAILGMLKGLCINKTGAKWWEPSDSPMLWRYEDQGMEAKFDGPMMYRAIDVPAILESMPCGEDLEFSFSVIDPHLPENNGPWKVRASEGRVAVEKGSESDFEIGIQPFTQAAMGEPSLSTVIRQGEVAVKSQKGLDAALRFFKPHPTFCLDFF